VKATHSAAAHYYDAAMARSGGPESRTAQVIAEALEWRESQDRLA
jgi:hypothetical protein